MRTVLDNASIIKPLLDDSCHYHVQIIRRKQDSGKQGQFYSRVLRPDSIGELYPDLCKMALALEARVYVNLTPIHVENAAWEMIRRYIELVKNGAYGNAFKIQDSVIGSTPTTEPSLKRWLIDMDGAEEQEVDTLGDWLKTLQPFGDKVVTKIPTPNGWHLITTKFDILEFENHQKYVVHKNNPTVLFAEVGK